MKAFWTNHWPQIIALILAAFFIFYVTGCEPKAASPTDPSRKMTRAELQLELKIFMSRIEASIEDLDQQEQLRDFVLRNALALGAQRPISPLSILTTIGAFYGVGSIGNSARKLGKRKPAGPESLSPSI